MTFKAMKMLVRDVDHSARLQGALFELGYGWTSGGATVKHRNEDALFTDQRGCITFSDTARFSSRIHEGTEAVHLEDLERMISLALASSHAVAPLEFVELYPSEPDARGYVTYSRLDRSHEDVRFVDAVGWTLVPELDLTPMEGAGVNPKQAYGQAKLPMSAWPALATAYGCLGLLNGGLKYGWGNFKATPVIMSIYIDALERHLAAFKNGEEYDEGEGVPHLAAILANTAIIIEARAVGSIVDDRQIQGGYLKELAKLTEIGNNLHKVHAGRNPRHYTLADNHLQGAF